jgi:paraquat-inducible protein A
MNGSAAGAGLWTCHDCHQLVAAPAGRDHARCPRCGGAVHSRKAASLQRTAALLVASAILYVPANVLPVMTFTSMGRQQSDTILSGVAHLLLQGQWPLAAIVFVASVVVPVLKLVALAWLVVSVHRGSAWRPAERTRLYRVTELVGRWSMVDIYVVTVLAALVQTGSVAAVEARSGAFFFGGVVVLTMIAAETFDPRLIWDRCGARRE